jgi:hypothetical protein
MVGFGRQMDAAINWTNAVLASEGQLMCGVEMWGGGLGAAYLLPALSSE